MSSKNVTTLFLILLLFGCQRRPAPLYPALQKAERLMQEHPDSALEILSHYSSKSFSDSADIAAYALLRTQADDKNYIDHTSDSLIKIATNYYDRHGSKLQQAQAHYYWGRIYQDRKDDVHTAEEYMIASSYVAETEDLEFASTVKLNLGFLLWSNNIYNAADSIYKEIMKIEKKLNDNEGLAICYNKLGNIAMQKDTPDYDMAKDYLEEALAKTKLIDNTHVKNDIYSTLAYFYSNLDKPQKALEYARVSEKFSRNNYHIYDIYLVIGHAYQQLNCIDSAKKYLNLSLMSKFNTTKKETYRFLKDIAQREGDKDKIIVFSNKYDAYRDSIDSEQSSDQVIISIKNAINNQMIVEHAKSDDRQKGLLSLLTAIILILICSFFYIRNKMKKSTVILQDDVIEKDKTIESLSTAIQHRKDFSDYQISDLIRQIKQHNKMHEGHDSKLLLTSEQWNDFEHAVSDLYPNLISHLNEKQYTLNEKDILFCCLVRLHYKFTEISYIFGCTPQAINKRKMKIFKKIEVDSIEEFEKFLKKF